jgi:hypothetical protein
VPQTRPAIPAQPHARPYPRESPVTSHQSLSLLESAVPIRLLSNKQNAPVSPSESALKNHFQLIEKSYTLSPVESALTAMPPATPLESALTKIGGVGGWWGGPPIPRFLLTRTLLPTPPQILTGAATSSLFAFNFQLLTFNLLGVPTRHSPSCRRSTASPRRKALFSSTSHQSQVTSHQK